MDFDFPQVFYHKVLPHGIGLRGQKIVNLGANTGRFARVFSKEGCKAIGIEPNAMHITEAKSLDKKAHVQVEYAEATAERTGLLDQSYDVVLAAQTWSHFDHTKALQEARRILTQNGYLVVTHLSWQPFEDNMVFATEKVIRHHMPDWQPSDHHQSVSYWMDEMKREGFEEIECFSFDTVCSYTPEDWCQHAQAIAGISPVSTPERAKHFYLELGILLKQRFVQRGLMAPHRCFTIVARPPHFHALNSKKNRLAIQTLSAAATPPWDLLLLADPSRHQIDTYLNQSRCYLALLNEQAIGVYVLMQHSETQFEIMNIAVAPKFQRQGLGRQLLQHAIEEAKKGGATTLNISTGNSSIAQLKLYQQCGFRLTGIEKGYFAAKYPRVIIENGIQCADKLQFSLALPAIAPAKVGPQTTQEPH